MSTRLDEDWFTCPVCGEVVDADALACPGCGADEQTGWSEQAEYDGLDLPGQQNDELDAARSSSGLIMTLIVLLLVGLMFLSLVMVL